MRAPKPSWPRPPKLKKPGSASAGRYGAREASAKDEIADGGGDNPFAKSPRAYRLSSGDTGLPLDE